MASPVLEQPAAAARGGNASDIAGTLVLGSCAAWALITAAGRDSRPEGVLLAVLAVAAGYACGRVTGALLPVAAPALAALGCVALALASPRVVPGAMAAATGAEPAGRNGATAALLILAAGAACCAAAAARSRRVRPALRLLAVCVVAVALAYGPPAAFAAALGVLLASLGAERMRRRLLGLAGLALLTASVTGGVWAVAGDRAPDGLTAAVEGQVTEQRKALWADAVDAVRERPLMGYGPDTFGDLGDPAQRTAVSDGKPHSALLQVTSEQGVPGGVLLAAAFGWLLLALWASPCGTPVVLTAGAALTAVAVLACVSNALSFTAVTTGAGALAGIATARRLS
ncbi:O-antigen ligase family protein [Streptomyces armeniacus]|uniref:O-antigen ligase family protein n=1 Tax=Streptomyces armeniacus TaxID=83291 RepID=A0A345XYB0_9ACTN|nr:O-antigen ligase family protein [Streptomyces armeniacus]AXK36626.1 O-antigen ligase family protein [Streptomyces armeniacus]